MGRTKPQMESCAVGKSREAATRESVMAGNCSMSGRFIRPPRTELCSPAHELVTSEATQPCNIFTLSFKLRATAAWANRNRWFVMDGAITCVRRCQPPKCCQIHIRNTLCQVFRVTLVCIRSRPFRGGHHCKVMHLPPPAPGAACGVVSAEPPNSHRVAVPRT